MLSQDASSMQTSKSSGPRSKSLSPRNAKDTNHAHHGKYKEVGLSQSKLATNKLCNPRVRGVDKLWVDRPAAPGGITPNTFNHDLCARQQRPIGRDMR